MMQCLQRAPMELGRLAASLHRVGARGLYAKVKDSPAAALERLQAKSEREGVDRELKARKNFMKPTLIRQRKKEDAQFNQAKRIRLQLVEELLLDKNLVPF